MVGHMSTSTWGWLMEPPASLADAAGSGPQFPSQAEAETWLGESWRALVEAGVEAVSLVDGDRVVYGPMSLLPE